MNKFDVFIFIGIGIIIILSIIKIRQDDFISTSDYIAIVGIIIGILTYLGSVRNEKQSLSLTMTLLDDKKRKILECTTEPQSKAEITTHTGYPRIDVNQLVDFLTKRGYLRKVTDTTGDKYERNF